MRNWYVIYKNVPNWISYTLSLYDWKQVTVKDKQTLLLQFEHVESTH